MSFIANLDALQSEAFQAVQPGRVVTLAMGRGTGKTFLDRVLIHSWALKVPGLQIGLLMPSLKQAKMVFWPQLLEDYKGPLKEYVTTNMSDLTALYSNGSRLTTWGAENAHSIRGQRFGMVVEDECDDIEASIETSVVQPTFSRSGSRAIWVKSGTPRRGRHGVLFRDYQLGQKREKGEGIEFVSFRFRSSESPQVDQAWLRTVKQLTNPLVYSREYDCDFDSGEGLVYPFDEAFHVRTPPPLNQFREFIVGVDHGWNDAGVMVLIGIQGHGNDAVAWALKERYESGVLPEEWDRRAREWSFAQTFWCDRSRPDRIQELRRRAGVNAQPAENAILPGVSRMMDLLAKREPIGDLPWCRFYVSPECINGIREFNSYKRKKDPHIPDAYLETPEDKNNHWLDAARYAITGRFGLAGSERSVVFGS